MSAPIANLRRTYNTERQSVATWIEHGVSSANTLVSRTHATETGKRHYLTHISASFATTPAAPIVLAIIAAGTTTVFRWGIVSPFRIDFSAPVEFGLGESVAIQLAAGGDGVVGYINMVGFTV